MNPASPTPAAGKQERLRAAYAKFQARLASIREGRLETLKKIFRRVDEDQAKAAREQLKKL